MAGGSWKTWGERQDKRGRGSGRSGSGQVKEPSLAKVFASRLSGSRRADALLWRMLKAGPRSGRWQMEILSVEMLSARVVRWPARKSRRLCASVPCSGRSGAQPRCCKRLRLLTTRKESSWDRWGLKDRGTRSQQMQERAPIRWTTTLWDTRKQ